jgi:hypothetical protein
MPKKELKAPLEQNREAAGRSERDGWIKHRSRNR